MLFDSFSPALHFTSLTFISIRCILEETMTKLTRLLVLIVLTCLGLTLALSPGLSTVSAQSVKKLTTATGASDPHSIDPQLASDQRDVDLANPMFPGLTIFDQDSGQVVPGLATGWDISTDGLIYTFHLM